MGGEVAFRSRNSLLFLLLNFFYTLPPPSPLAAERSCKAVPCSPFVTACSSIPGRNHPCAIPPRLPSPAVSMSSDPPFFSMSVAVDTQFLCFTISTFFRFLSLSCTHFPLHQRTLALSHDPHRCGTVNSCTRTPDTGSWLVGMEFFCRVRPSRRASVLRRISHPVTNSPLEDCVLNSSP